MRLTTSALDRRIESIASTLSSIGAIVAVTAVVFYIDRATGSAPYHHLYYLPIILAARRFEVGGAAFAAAGSIVLYHLANPGLLATWYHEADLVQIALFIGVGLVTAKFVRDARQLRQLATTDDLTGLHNLRSFEWQFARLVRSAHEHGQPLSLLALDMDRLKALNDVYGHLVGGEAVRTVGQIIAATVPDDSVACRYGGDEFVIAVPGRGLSASLTLAETIRAAVREAAPFLAGIRFPAGTLSVSVGAALLPASASAAALALPQATITDIATQLFRDADVALYRAKSAGRNTVAAFPTVVLRAG